MTDTEDVVARLQKREHYFRNASEGEYDANLMMKARFEIQSLSDRIDVLREAARPFAESIVIDPTKKRGERHWATCGKLTNLDDVLRLQDALDRAALHQEGINDRSQTPR